jgi:hypothetical protein
LSIQQASDNESTRDIRRSGQRLKVENQLKKRINLGAFVTVGLVGLLTIGVLLWIGQGVTLRIYEVLAEHSWQSAEATILSSQTIYRSQKSGKIWAPSWTYTYVVQGHQYTSQSTGVRQGFNVNWYRTQDLAERVAALSRPVGATVPAYYDPSTPQRSVLDKATWHGEDWISLIVLLFMFAVARNFFMKFGNQSRRL